MTLRIIILVIISIYSLMADVISTTGNINFYPNINSPSKMKLNSVGLAIGETNPSANLHVLGNVIVEKRLSLGSSTSQSNLNINGTMGFTYQMITNSTALNDYSYVLVDTSSDNIRLTLPVASTVEGRQYTIKKISSLNQLWIDGSDNIDRYDSSLELTAPSNGFSYLHLMSDGSGWNILDKSDDTLNIVAADNLTCWMKLNEMTSTFLSDSSGRNHPGSLVGDTLDNVSQSAKVDEGVGFNGSGNYISFTPFDTPPSNWTYSIWFYPTDTGGIPGLLGRTNNPRITWGAPGGTGFEATFLLGWDVAPGYQTSKSVDLALNTWHHAILTVDLRDSLNQKADLYVNGSLSTSKTWSTGNISLPSGTHYLNVRDSSLVYTGIMDEVRVYDRVITAVEAEAIYQESY